MAITEYKENGVRLFKVRVNRRSPVLEGFRVEKKKKGLKSLTEAKRWEQKFEREVERIMMEKEAEGISWEKLIAEWEIGAKSGDVFIRSIKVGTVGDYVSTLNHFTADWMKTPAHAIDKGMAWQVLEKVERECSVSRRKRLRTAIDAVLSWGMTTGRVRGMAGLPTEGYKTKVKTEETMPEILNISEIRSLIQAAKDTEHPWYPIWAMALLTGMRSGELYALRWANIDHDAKLIYVHENWTNKDGLGPTKGRYWRTVPVSQELERLLKQLHRYKGRFSDEVWTWKDAKREERNSIVYDDFVLPRFQAWKDGRQADILRTFCTGVGIQSVKFHTLRSCFATQLIKDGVAPAIIMKICGWRELKTMQRYIRLAGIEVKGATEGLKILPDDQVMGRVVELFSKNK